MSPYSAAFLAIELPDDDLARFRQHARTGRPLGSLAFPQQLETETGQVLLPQKRGPKSGKTGKMRHCIHLLFSMQIKKVLLL